MTLCRDALANGSSVVHAREGHVMIAIVSRVECGRGLFTKVWSVLTSSLFVNFAVDRMLVAAPGGANPKPFGRVSD